MFPDHILAEFIVRSLLEQYIYNQHQHTNLCGFLTSRIGFSFTMWEFSGTIYVDCVVLEMQARPGLNRPCYTLTVNTRSQGSTPRETYNTATEAVTQTIQQARQYQYNARAITDDTERVSGQSGN